LRITALDQCFPTLSPLATCGDRLFKCGNRKFSKSYISVERSNKLQFLPHISLNCGDNKETVAKKVPNVASGTFWLDIAVLDEPVFFLIFFSQSVPDEKVGDRIARERELATSLSVKNNEI
jgi:hypothetical protein